MPREAKNPLYIDWATSEAKIVLMKDLEEGTLTLDSKAIPPSVAWQMYKDHEAFVGLVCYEQFAVRLNDHRKLFRNRRDCSQREMEAYLHDRQLYPRKPYNNKNEPVFAFSPAQPLLRKDIEAKLHVNKTPTQLWATRREYKKFSPDKFRERIYQEIRYQRFVMYLERKREKKAAEARKADEVARVRRIALQEKRNKEAAQNN